MKIFNKKQIQDDNNENENKEVDINDNSSKTNSASIAQGDTQKSSINWFSEDDKVGELSVDVFEKNDKIIIQSTVAGVKPEDIDIVVDEDTITISGKRQQQEEVKQDEFFYQECYWGGFKRVLKLPLEVSEDGAEASLKNGVLTIKLTKIKKPKSVKVPVG